MKLRNLLDAFDRNWLLELQQHMLDKLDCYDMKILDFNNTRCDIEFKVPHFQHKLVLKIIKAQHLAQLYLNDTVNMTSEYEACQNEVSDIVSKIEPMLNQLKHKQFNDYV